MGGFSRVAIIAKPNVGYLQTLPRALALEERLLLDGIGTAWGAIEIAFSQLCQALETVRAHELGPISLVQSERSALAIYAWTVVDHIHSLRLFFRQLSIAGDPEIAGFVQKFDVARQMRNAMDHRSQTLSNQAKRKRSGPVFGVLSVMTPTLSGGRWAVHQIALSGAHHEQHAFPAIDTWARPIEGALSDVRLSASGKEIDLSEAVAAACAATEHVCKWAEALVTEAVAKYAKDNVLDHAAILSEKSGLTVCISAQFGAKTQS
jgi:hypothetical protein